MYAALVRMRKTSTLTGSEVIYDVKILSLPSKSHESPV